MRILITFFKGFREGTHFFGQNIAIVVNSAMLFVIYFTGVGLTSIFSKICGKKFMQLELSTKKTYWTDLNLKLKPIEAYYRQF